MCPYLSLLRADDTVVPSGRFERAGYNVQHAVCNVQRAVRGVQFSSLQCVRCIHSALSPFEGPITVLSRKTMSVGRPCQRAHGVVVSHPLSMREALGSIPSVSILFLAVLHARLGSHQMCTSQATSRIALPLPYANGLVLLKPRRFSLSARSTHSLPTLV